ncbi:DNA-directed RNA polymerase, subunit E'' [Candidatus Micrarchaeota archaeon]|nr:DNA-directed RNA polymerase, subunit E'' [Candidatus Micrarchaeota archaeon]
MKACVNCGLISEEDVKECPRCSSSEFTEKYSDMLIVINADESEIARNLGITGIGQYALKMR